MIGRSSGSHGVRSEWRTPWGNRVTFVMFENNCRFRPGIILWGLKLGDKRMRGEGMDKGGRDG